MQLQRFIILNLKKYFRIKEKYNIPAQLKQIIFYSNKNVVRRQYLQVQNNIEFKYIFEDLKSQLQGISPIQSLLKHTQKTTKKLECLNLYAQVDKRSFDLQIEEDNIFAQMNELYKAIMSTQQQSPTQQQIYTIKSRIDQIKQKYIKTFDVLTKQQELINQQLQITNKILKQIQKKQELTQNQIKQQYEDEQFQQAGFQNEQLPIYKTQNILQSHEQRIIKLNRQIDQIHAKITKINYGKGKWFDTDHKDFIKIYNRCAGNDKKIINQGIKLLGMKQTQIMDHLQLYQSYLQFEKQKKIVTEEFRQIKYLQQEQKKEEEQQKLDLKKLQQKVKKQKQIQERLRKKQEIEKFKLKKAQQKQRMIKKQQEQTQSKLKVAPLLPSKKKQIMQRNRILIQNQQKKLLQAKNKKLTVQKGNRLPSSKKVIQSQKK